MEEYRIDPSIAYDVVELPTRGIHYTSGKKSVRVAYLTAADENILLSPNLVNTKSIIDEILKRKILDKDISVDDLHDEDIEAIMIFLRNTSFGSEYSISLIDPKTEKEFKFTVDLSSLTYKKFDLVPDNNGEYSYFLPKSKIDITFKFLNKKQEKEIDEIKKSWNGIGFPPIITKQLEFMIKSVQGNRDMMNIKNLIDNLPILDSQSFRKYVNENKPGLDLKQKVTAPSGEEVEFFINFGVEFFRPFYGL
jgi:hypothetical protein